MPDLLPDYLSQGERARLFPVLSTTSKEGRTTSIVLACLGKVDEFASDLLASIGQRAVKKSRISTYTEVVLKGQQTNVGDRPDGLLVMTNGKRVWRALVEAKVGNSPLDPDQIERYRALAKDHAIDCVITISNQFATRPESHPLAEVRKSRSRIPVFHWSWMHILTTADLLLNNQRVADGDQKILLHELRRFLSHESAGVRGFDRMPPEWTALNKLVSSGGRIPAKSAEASTVIDAWHQETRHLTLILSRLTETTIQEKLAKKHREDPLQRHRDELQLLRDQQTLSLSLDVPDAAAPLEIVADVSRRSVDVGMTLRAPEDRRSSKARLNWLLRQIKTDAAETLFVRLHWPGSSMDTTFSVDQLRQNSSVIDDGKAHLQVRGFHVFACHRLGARFTQQVNFISDLEALVPAFYAEIGSNLTAWKRRAPRISSDKLETEDVTGDTTVEDNEGDSGADQ